MLIIFRSLIFQTEACEKMTPLSLLFSIHVRFVNLYVSYKFIAYHNVSTDDITENDER